MYNVYKYFNALFNQKGVHIVLFVTIHLCGEKITQMQKTERNKKKGGKIFLIN